MLHPRLNRIRQRLDALREGTVLSAGILDRALAAVESSDPASPMKQLLALDRDLDRVGIHTAADAKLLRSLGAKKGRVGALAQGLEQRGKDVLDEYEARLGRLERAVLSRSAGPGALSALERGFAKLARAVKVADLFASPDEAVGEFEIFDRPLADRSAPPASAKLAVAEFWAERARGNIGDLVQKRRDLDAAHEMLLRLGAEVDRDRARHLRTEVAQARERARSVPAVRSLQDLARHLRLAARKDPRSAYRSVRALYERAVEANDRELATLAREAACSMLPRGDELRRALERSEQDHLAEWAADQGEARAPRKRRLGEPPGLESKGDEALARMAFELEDERLEAFELAAGCARYFDVEDALAEEIVEAELRVARPVPRRVGYPTQTMAYEFTGSLDELPNFIITDPRTLIHDLASNRQVVRAYLEELPPPRPRRVRKTAVRVYVCDASGSMHGPRARFRDAILLAELNNLAAKAHRGLPFDPLYFSFFNDSPTELARVDSAAEAIRQIEKLFRSSPAEGQTDITLALMSAFESIRSAQGKDPYLARATVVLVTDGEDGVDLELLRRTRAPLGQVDIALSFISLGEENTDLKSLVFEQRAKGGRAFYHHLADAEIAAARTEFDTTWRTLLPRETPTTAGALEALLPHLEALEAVAQGRPAPAPPRSEGSFDALFPEPKRGAEKSARPPKGADWARLADILEAIAEAASLAPADARAAEAVTLLNHLLGLYGTPLTAYLAAVAAPDEAVAAGLERVRLLCRPFG
ncbi:MAG: VWA domain-containing protein [Myxococcales bacterium]|nr:VWA domain-containing protein [Myxococcales bacterium]